MGRKLGIIGAGKVGEALAVGVAQRGLVAKADMILSVRRRRTAPSSRRGRAFRTILDNSELARLSDAIIIAVKPKDV
jgi:pyrroline-5-carboxylate reductase